MKIHNYKISLNREGAVTVTVLTVALIVLQLLGRGVVYFGPLTRPEKHVVSDIVVYEILGFFTLILIGMMLYILCYVVIGIGGFVFDVEKLD